MTPGGEPTPAELARLVEYLDGGLPEDEMLDLELRLEREPTLRGALDELERADALFRPNVRPRAPQDVVARAPARLLRFPPRWAGLAAAAALVVGGLIALRALTRPGAPPLEVAVAVLETSADPAELNRRLGLAPDWLPASLGRARGLEPSGAEPAAGEYVEAVRDRLDAAAARALAGQAGAAPRGRFVLAVRPREDVSALLVSLRPDGAVERLFPRAPVPVLDEGRQLRDLSRSRLRAGEEALLPAPVVELLPDAPAADALRFDPGFVGAVEGAPRVLLAVRGAALDAGLLEALDAWARDGLRDAAALAAWLEARGFRVLDVDG